MNIRAKMRCNSVSNNGTTTENVALSAVTSGSEENKSFATATPCASFLMSIDNPAAQGKFESGKEYYIDISPAP